MKYLGCFLLLFCFISVFAETLTGLVITSQGVPVPNATLYIRERAMGIAADEEGNFRLLLDPGTYTFDIRSLGYALKTEQVTVATAEQQVVFRLDETSYQLHDVLVRADGEDPAYPVMRRAISMAPWYLNQVKSYESEVYLKGKLRVKKIPKLFNLSVSSNEISLSSDGKKTKTDITKQLFLIESHHRIIYTAPQQYENTVLASKSSMPEEFGSKMFPPMLTGSIYDPEAYGCISPLSPTAFSYYRFALEGVKTEGNHVINKIRVIPRKKNPQLLSGYLYVIDNTWNIHQADLSMNIYGIRMHFETTYNEVEPDVFLPTTYDVDMDLGMLGVKAEGKCYTSVQYTSMVLQPKPTVATAAVSPATPSLSDDGLPETATMPQTVRQQKAQQKLEALLEKEELSNRDALKMARLMQVMAETDRQREERESLEEKTSGPDIRTTVDTSAMLRDSGYWSEIRTLPLLPDEDTSYRKKDSLLLSRAADSMKNHAGSQAHRRSAGSVVVGIFTGDSWRMGSVRIHYNGLLFAVPEYNFTDGFWIGQQLKGSWRMDDNRSIDIAPSVYYATARKHVNWYTTGSFNYAPMRFGLTKLEVGNTTLDYNGKDRAIRFINSLSSLFLAENPLRFYQSRYIMLSNRLEIMNGLQITPRVSLEKRNSLTNHTSYSFRNRLPEANLLPVIYGEMPFNTALKGEIAVSYTPRQHYRISNGKKSYTTSSWPTFLFGYQQAIATHSAHSASYGRIQLGVEQIVKVNPFNDVRYLVEAGTFLGASRRIYFPDYKHFNTYQLFLSGQAMSHGFSLAGQYDYATDRRWAEAHFTWISQYLLLKRLPFMQTLPVSEGLHIRTLQIPGINYSETGYSVGFAEEFRMGVFCGFRNGRYEGIGVSLSIPMLGNVGY